MPQYLAEGPGGISAADVVQMLDETDGLYLRAQFERFFGKPLEELAAARDKDIAGFRKLLDPARAVIRAQPFLSGANPAYADYILFSLFQWARIVSAFEVLEPNDALAAWGAWTRGLFGQGVLASVAILALGIALDRVTQGRNRRRVRELA